jgi:hypothetical protein
MGTFRIEIQTVGGHGCQREKKNGEQVEGCGFPTCPDCLTREFVKKLQAIGCPFSPGGGHPGAINYAVITHWPYSSGTVYDDLVSGRRAGSF